MIKTLRQDQSNLAAAIRERMDDFTCCYQCGMCINSCPVGAINSRFNPRLIMHKVAAGLEEELTLAKEIWLCSQCYACQERCPQEIAICDLMVALRNLSVTPMGKTGPHAKLVQLMRNWGGLYDLDDFVNDDREMIGLPFKELNKDDLKKIIDSGPLKSV